MTGKPGNCDGCGLCCMGQNLVPGCDTWLARQAKVDPPRAIPAPLLLELETIVKGPCSGNGGEPCVWLDRATGKCRHYDLRPDVCREFEVGCRACLAYRTAMKKRD